jgi:hypothetical protein
MTAAFEIPQRGATGCPLKHWLTRIRPEAESLGPYLPLPVRVGKAIVAPDGNPLTTAMIALHHVRLVRSESLDHRRA